MNGKRPATETEARALASAVRLRILRLCLDTPRTNKEIAERLEANPASVLHHVRTLVETGFLTALPVRRGSRGSRERPYLATRKSWTLSMDDSGVPGGGNAMIAVRGVAPADGRDPGGVRGPAAGTRRPGVLRVPGVVRGRQPRRQIVRRQLTSASIARKPMASLIGIE
jgi:DNA-binding transcriptional ArsR family regulator